MEKQIPFTGILSDKAEENPGFLWSLIQNNILYRGNFIKLVFT